MSISVNLYYHGKNGSALKFVREMEESGIAEASGLRKGTFGISTFSR